MSNTDYSFDGLDELEQELTQMIEQDYPEEFKKMVIQIAYDLQGRTKEKTPVDTSTLRDGWEIGQIQKRGDEYYIEVYNNVEYAEPVEYGHRTRGGKGFVPGAHMMEISLAEVSALLPGYLQGWLNEFLESHDI